MRGKPDADPGSEVEDSGSFLERPEADDPGAIVYVCVSVLLLPRDRMSGSVSLFGEGSAVQRTSYGSRLIYTVGYVLMGRVLIGI